MAQQTAVEWLEQKAKEFAIDLNLLHYFEQAKEMEKEQMYKVASFWRGKENEIEKHIFQQYYNETFGK